MILILGGGLAGLSTAYHLGDTPHLVLEAAEEPGGLCLSREVNGFVFDYTGHLLHLRDPRATRLIERLLPDTFDVVERNARIRMQGATLPFPFQANLHGLPPETIADCITGFVESMGTPVPDDPEVSFRDWSLAVLGKGISEAFMFPYNCKLFCREPERMTADWVSWAVPRPNLHEVVRGALGLVNRGMGYNSTFRYPSRGGIRAIPDAFAARVEHLRCGARVTAVDLEARTVEIAGGETIDYDSLVVTIPLPRFLELAGVDGQGLDWSVVGCLNLGVERPEIADGAHWIYFPDPEVPFYRAGFPSNFSRTVAPPGTSSIYVEFGLRRDQPIDRDRLYASAVSALEREGILRSGDRILARDWVRIDPGYVIFDRRRQQVMRRVVPLLEGQGVHLIGRYGAWTYSYMERAILDGLELAQRLARPSVAARG